MDKIVYFLRHGEAKSNAEAFVGGHGKEIPLTEKGIAQAKATAPLLAHIPFDKIYCSELDRARQTAALALPGRECEYRSQLQEINVGSLVFKPRAECYATYGEAFSEHYKNCNFVPYGGENREMLNVRTATFMRELEESAHQTIGVVCHAIVMQSVAHYVLGNVSYTHLSLDNCGICAFQYKHGAWNLLRWNVTAKI